jgi:hypothetical protein
MPVCNEVDSGALNLAFPNDFTVAESAVRELERPLHLFARTGVGQIFLIQRS